MRGRRDIISRRQWLRITGALAGSGAFAHLAGGLDGYRLLAQQAAAPANPVDAMRAQMAMAPIETVKLSGNLVMLSGPGGNVVVLTGNEGKVVVDTFVQPVWAKLKGTLDGLGTAPIKLAINTHWHFDHADNNANFRQAGAGILAHANTAKRLGETHQLLGMTFTPAPAAARPTLTFTDTHSLQANGESMALSHIPPAHTDTDVAVRYMKANVLHMGDVYFNGTYPVIDPGTGGSINGMIRGAEVGLKLADGSTRIVPGHGALSDRAGLTKYRDMLVTVRDRVQKLKKSGRSLQDTVAAKPTADLDPTWGMGFMPPNDFVTVVYSTL
jgi:cyclase